MRKTAKTALAALCILLLLASCTPYDMDRTESENGVTCCMANFLGSGAFVLTVDWDGDPEHTGIVIPETCGGQKIVSLGGFTGTGVPTPMMVTVNGKYYEGPLVPAEELCFRISFGPSVKKITRIASPLLEVEKDGETRYFRPVFYFTASEDNEAYYTENGRVYDKEDGSLLEGIAYWDQTGEEY